VTGFDGVSDRAGDLAGGLATDLGRYPFARALAELSAIQGTGTLSLRSGTSQKTIVIREGAPVHADSNLAEEALDRFLVSRGDVEAEVAREAMTTAVISGRNVGEVLVEMGALRPEQLFQALERAIAARILSAFAWQHGELSYDPNEPDVASKILLRLSPAPVIFRGVCSYAPIEVVRADFTEIGLPYRARPSMRDALAQLRPKALESRVANALSAAQTCESLATVARVKEDEALRVLYALVLLRIAGPAEEVEKEIARAERDKARRTASRRSPKAGAPVVSFLSPSTSGDAARESSAIAARAMLSDHERDAIDRMYLATKSRDYFELLDVPENATFDQLKRSFLDLCDRFSPMSYRDRDTGDHALRLEEIFLILVRAFSTLAVPASRKDYLLQTRRRDARVAADSGTPSAHREKELPEPRAEARDLVLVDAPPGAPGAIRIAAALINIGQAAEAASRLRDAPVESPDDALTHAFLGYAIYRASPSCGMAEAIHHLQQAMALDSRCLHAFLFLGRIYEAKKDYSSALGAYSECLRIDPEHREAGEASPRLEQLLRNR